MERRSDLSCGELNVTQIGVTAILRQILESGESAMVNPIQGGVIAGIGVLISVE
jgi:hypothetical protein